MEVYESAEAVAAEVVVAAVVVLTVVAVVVVVVVVVVRVAVLDAAVEVERARDEDARLVLLTILDDDTNAVGRVAARDHAATDDEANAIAADCWASSAAASAAARAEALAALADLADDEDVAAALAELLRLALADAIAACRLAAEAERVAEAGPAEAEVAVGTTPTTAATCERVAAALGAAALVQVVAAEDAVDADAALASLNEMASSPVAWSPPSARKEASDMVVYLARSDASCTVNVTLESKTSTSARPVPGCSWQGTPRPGTQLTTRRSPT